MDYKDKIRKLLALAKSPEPEEAKLALLKARKLMAEHKLTERDLEEHDTTVIQQEIDETFSKKANSWMAPLSTVIGENYCCAAYRCKRGAKTTVWRVGFIGLKDDFEICTKIFKYAVRCIKAEQKKLRKQYRDYYTPQEIAKICDSYGYGFVSGVNEAFAEQNEENQEYGLVLKVPKEAKDELSKMGPPKEFKKPPKPKTVGELDMASNQGAEIAWLVMAATCHETFGYGKDRLARLKQNSMNNYKQYLEWEKEDKDLALDRLRRCVQDALKEDLRVTDTDDRKGMLSTPGRGPSVYETAAVYSEIFRRARAGRAVAPLAVYSAAKYDETMTAARKRASVLLGL